MNGAARPRIEGLDLPTLILWGEDDALAHVDVALELNEAIVTSTLPVLPGCSHFLPEEAPGTLAPLVGQYLRGRYLGRPHVHAAGPLLMQLGRRPPETEP